MSAGYSYDLVMHITRKRKADPTDVVMKLLALGIKHDKSIIEIADLVGVSRQAIYEWIAGNYKPKSFLLDKINTVIAAIEENHTKG
ncbi:MAG: helix-turn-helix domain-containing protein [Minisyncoccota bacterium]